MQHSYLIKTVIPSKLEPVSYFEICQSLCVLIEKLSGIDSAFSDFNAPSAGRSSCSYQVPCGSTEQQINAVAEQMAHNLIEFDRDDIAKHDNEPNPTINFGRSIGLNCSLLFTKVKKNRLEAKFSLGGNFDGIFNIEYFAKNLEKHYSIDWYENIIKCLAEHFNPKYSALMFATMEFYAERRELVLPEALGWMTYFQNDSLVNVPETLPGTVVEEYNNGKFLLLSRDEEYSESLSLDEKRELVLSVMKRLKAIS